MTTNEEEIKKSARLRKIMQVMRKYHFVSNFYHQTNPQAICQALQELGPTFIKLGQILSTRPDLVSPAYIKELRHLQDQVKADSFATVEQTFEEETGKKINEEFASFAEKPFASASIGQVHHATLKDGTPVVVKVQHPEVGKLVNTDLALLRKAVVLFKYVPQDIAVVDLDKVIDELSTSLLSEVNTLEEAKNGEEFYTLNDGDGPILVPKVYMKYCAPKILVNEAMEGKSIRYRFKQSNDNDQEATTVNHEIATTLVNNFLKQNPNANEFASEIVNEILKDKDLANNPNSLSIAYNKILASKYIPKQNLLEDEDFINNYILTNEKINEKIISNYIKKLNNNTPKVIASSHLSSVGLTPNKKPTTLEEARVLANNMFKQ